MAENFKIKDSGKRQEFASGMVRDTDEGKIGWHRIAEGPMLRRWAEHLTKGATKYPDRENGQANWTLANDEAALARFKASAYRHFMQWFFGDRDEDHGAAVFFNINGAEYVAKKLAPNKEKEIENHEPRPQSKEESYSLAHIAHFLTLVRGWGHGAVREFLTQLARHDSSWKGEPVTGFQAIPTREQIGDGRDAHIDLARSFTEGGAHIDLSSFSTSSVGKRG